MTDEQKVYIRGIDMIAALDRLGGKTDRLGSIRLCALGNIPFNVFIIGHDGEIAYMDSEGEVFEIIKDNYREIKLPEQWKDGDILVNRYSSDCFAVCESPSKTRDDVYHFYIYVQDLGCNGIDIDAYGGNILHSTYRLATSSEIEHFHELLHKNGKDWDAEKKQLVDWQWKPNVGDNYWYISAKGRIVMYEWNSSPADEIGLAFGNCFPSREEAEAALERVKKALKGE